MFRTSIAKLAPLILVLAWLGCSDTAGVGGGNGEGDNGGSNPDAVPTPDNPLEGFVTVAPNVRLHYLDFGGSGEPLLLLAGLGNTAHVFRSFAPLLTGQHRVRALTRRGFGQSSQPAGGYDPQTLANDIRAFLDSLGLTRVHLVGHSIAGEELSRFAVDHPSRLGKLVYLDAAYDRTELPDPDTAPVWANPPPPTPADLASRQAFGVYITGILGVALPDAETAAGTIVAADGRVLGTVTPAWIQEAITDAVASPGYASITVPALGLYAVAQSPDDAAPWLTPSSPDWAAAETYLATVLGPAHEAQRVRFDSEVANSTVVEYAGGNHYLYLWEPAQVAAAVLAHLANP